MYKVSIVSPSAIIYVMFCYGYYSTSNQFNQQRHFWYSNLRFTNVKRTFNYLSTAEYRTAGKSGDTQ